MALTASSRGAYGEESPEALRRRADVLLDEMMLGGIDAGAAGPHTGPNGSSWSSADNGAHWPPAEEIAFEYDGASPGSNGSYGGFDAPHGEDLTGEEPNRFYAPVDAGAAAPGETNSPLVSAEERYTRLAGAQSLAQPFAPSSPATAPPAGSETPAPDRAGAERGPSPGGASGGAHEYVQGSSAVRRQSPSLASTMSVGVRAANRSNLLPRDNELDAETAQQEINDLLRAVATTLPPGNEAVERSRHLLGKAQTLLQSDPTRTAEVDYYLQQVRRIVQRTRQTQQWSSLYKQRLSLYLWAWLLLSAMVVAAVALFTGDVIEFFAQLVDTPELGLIVQQAPVLLAGAFAGVLGASLSALFNMQRHGSREFAYFDRKYGLRGLLLPLLGMFLGFALALFCAIVFILAEIDPGLHAWAVAVPAVLAFMVGFGQEWLYGARS
jgi:hypothetical protein